MSTALGLFTSRLYNRFLYDRLDGLCGLLGGLFNSLILSRRLFGISLLLCSCSSCCFGPGSSSSPSLSCFSSNGLQASKSCSLSFSIAGGSESLQLSCSCFLDSQSFETLSSSLTKDLHIGPASAKSGVELVPAFSFGSCNVSLSSHFLSSDITCSYFHDIAPLGPPGVVNSASAFFSPACFQCFVMVDYTSPSNCYLFSTLNCSCSLCGCGPLSGLSFPY